MIKARQKPMKDIALMVAPFSRVLVLGCNTCSAICLAGGEKEVAILASTLRMQSRLNGKQKELGEFVVKRQCEREFVEEARELIQSHDVVLSLACGVGMNFVAEMFPEKPVLPGNDTMFLGLPRELGVFAERCVACGDCIIHLTGGLCPIARCAKHLFNGPCGGSCAGRCEISPDIPCIWQMIYDKLARLGQLASLEELIPVRDWKANEALGPRSFVRQDLQVKEK